MLSCYTHHSAFDSSTLCHLFLRSILVIKCASDPSLLTAVWFPALSTLCVLPSHPAKAVWISGSFNLGGAFPKVSRLFSFMFILLVSLFDHSLFSAQELQKAVDHRKAIILSINLCSSEFTQTGSEESQDLQDRLSQMNGRWDHVCSLLEEWRGLLQDALMQCQVCGALGMIQSPAFPE